MKATLQLALEALESCHITFHEDEDIAEAITAIKEALAQPEQLEVLQLVHKADIDLAKKRATEAQPEQEPKCNPHPKAPHGFNRNASHANDRYTCECEGWDAYDAGYQAGVMVGIEASMGQEPEQEPDSESVDALRTLSYCDGLKAGWNFCVADDHDGFERAQAATSEAVRILKAQPKQPEQEPVAWRVRWPKVGGGHTWVMNDAPLMAEHGFVNEPLYTTPPQRKPLTDEQIDMALLSFDRDSSFNDIARAIEAAHGIKGEA